MECRHKGNRSTIPAGRKQKTRHFQKIIGIPQFFPDSRHFCLFRQNKKRMKIGCAVVAVASFCKEKPELFGINNEKTCRTGRSPAFFLARSSRSLPKSHPVPCSVLFLSRTEPPGVRGAFFPQFHASIRYPQTIRGPRCPSGPLLSRHACFQAQQKQVMRFSPEERQGEAPPIESSSEDFSFFSPVLTGRREFRILKQRTVTL